MSRERDAVSHARHTKVDKRGEVRLEVGPRDGAGGTGPQARQVAIKCRVTPADTKDSATVFTVQEGLGALLTRVLIETVVDCR